MFKVIFFDFDGVILDSADIKTEAFYELFLSYGVDVATKVREYHQRNQGVSRFEKFKHIHQEILKKQYSDDIAQTYSNAFSKLVLYKVLNCKYVEGVIEFLKDISTKGIQSYVLSATPQSELRQICQTRGLLRYFADVFGSPETKIELGKRIIRASAVKKEDIVFIGDSMSDFDAAQRLGVSFIGRIEKVESNPFPQGTATIKNFREIKLWK